MGKEGNGIVAGWSYFGTSRDDAYGSVAAEALRSRCNSVESHSALDTGSLPSHRTWYGLPLMLLAVAAVNEVFCRGHQALIDEIAVFPLEMSTRI
jgi:hypothetical protein